MFAVIASVDYLFFAKNMGILNDSLEYVSGFFIEHCEKMLNIIVVCVLAFALSAFYKKIKKYIGGMFLIASAAFLVMSAKNIVTIEASVSDLNQTSASIDDEKISFKLSKNGKNVVVLMLDRAMGEYVPYIMNEKPELKEKFSGFTYYQNTISFGGHTNFGSPALYGGYEYTPVEMNKRDKESLEEKQNDALKVMPVLFDQNGFEVTVCDPTYAGYQWTPDLSIYDDYSGIDTYITKGVYTAADEQTKIVNRKRDFFCYSVMKVAPLVLQDTIYNDGQYYKQKNSHQRMIDKYHAQGMSFPFMKSYTSLQNLDKMTDIANNDTNTFLMMSNDTTHDVMMLQEPDYIPVNSVDNTEYEQENSNRFILNGAKLNMDTEGQVSHYQCNMAAMLQLADWMDYLKENDVYDNTRIIIVADHGFGLHQIDSLDLGDGIEEHLDTEYYYPLLMIKDFNSKEFTTSDEFMTNGDVPTYAMEDLIDNPTNPFTGKLINNEAKNRKQYILASSEFDVIKNNGNQYLPGQWLSVHDNRLDKNNWEILNEGVFPEER